MAKDFADMNRLANTYEMNATSKPESVSKLMKAWESKNAQRALRGAGATTMALSLAACGGSDDVAAVVDTTPVVTPPVTPAPVTPLSAALTIANDAVTGTTGNDSVTGARIDTVQTLNSGDTIALGEGTDSLSATLNAGTITPASITGVETITFTALGAATVDFDNVSGVTALASTGSSATLLVDDIQALTTSITVANNSAAQSFVFKDAAVSGTTNSLVLNLDGAAAVVNIGGETDADGDIETLTINATGGASDLGVGNGFGADATSITVNASAALDLGSTAQFLAVTNFDAAASTAGVTAVFATRAAAGEATLSLTGGAGADNFDIGAFTLANYGDITVNMGAGNDTLDMGAAQDTDTGSSFNGGAGTDTLIISGSELNAAEFARISNFEVLNIETTGLTQDADFFTGTTFGTGAIIADLTVSDLANNSVLNVNHSMAAFLAGNLKTDTANDSVTVNIGGTAGAVTLAALRLSSTYENVTLNSQGSAANVLTEINTNAFNNLTVTGATALTITGTGTLTGVLDASAHTGAFTATTSTTAITVNGGTGVDTLTSGLLATGVTQTLNGGDGNDVLTAGAIATTGNLVLNGGAGMDVINTAAIVAANAVTSTAVVNGGAGFDFINIGDTPAAGGTVLQDIVSTVTSSADLDVVDGFATTVDDLDYNGALLNGANTTVVNATGASLAAAVAVDNAATVFFVTDNLTGGAATTLTALAEATIASDVATLATSFESAFVAAIGSTAIAGLDNAVGAGESVLLAFDNGAESVVMRFTNSDTTVANTITAAELEIVAVFDGTATLAAGDII